MYLTSTSSVEDPIPSESELNALNIELSILISIYILTIFFALYNIIMYLWKQKRYSTWLMTFFYLFSLMVLITRISQYCYSIKFNNFMKNVTP